MTARVRGVFAVASVAAGILVAGADAVFAYSGVGAAAVERALGRIPASEDELEAEIVALEAKLAAGDGSPETRYTLAVLSLNRPKGLGLEGPRRMLAEVLAADPGYQDALDLWMDLVPAENELNEVETRLNARAATPTAEARWALANVKHLRGHYAEAELALADLVTMDALSLGRARWLEARMAGERRRDEDATRLFEEALAALDARAARDIWRASILVAAPDEIAGRAEGAIAADVEFLRAFWKRRDVFPLTEKNERLAEHLQRLAHARGNYALRSNGRAYLTMKDSFKRLSPDTPFHASDVVFEYQERMPVWLDHRGLVYVRHGQPDRVARSTDAVRAETWVYVRLSSRPLLLHFVERRGVGESVLALNLAQAMASGSVVDDPDVILENAANFQDLYGSRGQFHQIFQRIAASRSNYEVKELLQQEAALVAGVLREIWSDDTNRLIDKDDILPFAASSVNFRGEDGLVDVVIHYGIPVRELLKKRGKDVTGPADLVATVVVYSRNWKERIQTAEHSFQHDLPVTKGQSRKDDLLVGTLELRGLEPKLYKFAFQVSERGSGKIGVTKGTLTADYYGPEWVELSDLLFASEVGPKDRVAPFQRGDQRLAPIPSRTLPRSRQGKIYYEIYGLGSGEDGKSHYRVEYRVLQIQEEASLGEKILGVGMNVAGIFFPYPVFFTRVGLFGLDVASKTPEKGLDIVTEERVGVPGDSVTRELFTVDAKKYAPGVYQVYVTVKDYVSGSISTRSVRFAITG